MWHFRTFLVLALALKVMALALHWGCGLVNINAVKTELMKLSKVSNACLYSLLPAITQYLITTSIHLNHAGKIR